MSAAASETPPITGTASLAIGTSEVGVLIAGITASGASSVRVGRDAVGESVSAPISSRTGASDVVGSSWVGAGADGLRLFGTDADEGEGEGEGEVCGEGKVRGVGPAGALGDSTDGGEAVGTVDAVPGGAATAFG